MSRCQNDMTVHHRGTMVPPGAGNWCVFAERRRWRPAQIVSGFMLHLSQSSNVGCHTAASTSASRAPFQATGSTDGAHSARSGRLAAWRLIARRWHGGLCRALISGLAVQKEQVLDARRCIVLKRRRTDLQCKDTSIERGLVAGVENALVKL